MSRILASFKAMIKRERGSASRVRSVSNCNGTVEGVCVVAGFYSKTIAVRLVCLEH